MSLTIFEVRSPSFPCHYKVPDNIATAIISIPGLCNDFIKANKISRNVIRPQSVKEQIENAEKLHQVSFDFRAIPDEKDLKSGEFLVLTIGADYDSGSVFTQFGHNDHYESLSIHRHQRPYWHIVSPVEVPHNRNLGDLRSVCRELDSAGPCGLQFVKMYPELFSKFFSIALPGYRSRNLKTNKFTNIPRITRDGCSCFCEEERFGYRGVVLTARHIC